MQGRARLVPGSVAPVAGCGDEPSPPLFMRFQTWRRRLPMKPIGHESAIAARKVGVSISALGYPVRHLRTAESYASVTEKIGSIVLVHTRSKTWLLGFVLAFLMLMRFLFV